MNKPVATVRVWDLPTRLFHWSLAVCVVAAFVCVKIGGLMMDWHTRFGMAVLVLLLFRLVWGLAGPRYARFSSFIRGPGAVISYLRGKWEHRAGHNPLASLSVIALLVVLSVQAFSGLFADDDVMTTGPLTYLDSSWSATMTWLHKTNEPVIIILVVLHVAAVLWYQFKRRENIIGPMVHGNTPLPHAVAARTPPARDHWVVRVAALVLVVAATAFVWWLTTLAPAGGDSFM